MIPSLVARELRRGIVEYLTTTFELADGATRQALSEFLQDPVDGIFRGPFLRVRPPFQTVDESWVSPLDFFPADWAADGIRPYRHQAEAWGRLAGRSRTPLPTILTTGTGSGKTEGFEVPILDHVVWARDGGVPGIKALILYPMNALASDQAGRFARRIASDPTLDGVRVGLFVGLEPGTTTTKSMTDTWVVDDQTTLLDDPPDVLLTNYKMLDRLLTSESRSRLWSANTPESLRYVVLDEFHTYDGAQGTDVAMLLRRLGTRLRMSTPGPAGRGGDPTVLPLGAATPVATSATLGSSTKALTDLRGFAWKVFGRDFDEGSVIGEHRVTAAEAAGPQAIWEMPDPHVVAKLDPDDDGALMEAATLFLGEPCPIGSGGGLDCVALGEKIKSHYLMKPILEHTGPAPVRWADVAARIAHADAGWAKAHADDPVVVELALAWFVALVSKGRRYRVDKDGHPKRRPDGSQVDAELFQVEVQLWVREVSRLLRAVDKHPRFRWFDSSAGPIPYIELPSVFCRFCGRAGWATVASDKPCDPGCVGDKLLKSAATTYQSALARSEMFRSLIAADPAETDTVWWSTDNGQLYPADNGTRLPVLIMDDRTGAKQHRCPSCQNDEAVRFLGSAVTSLASVTVSQLFGSRLVNDDERKLIAFTDSVQDAAHRAGFFTGRSHRFNLRSLVAGALRDAGKPMTVDGLADSVLDAAATPHDRFTILPPDLHGSRGTASLLTDTPGQPALDELRDRTRLEIDLEVGLRSRFGRTLELTGASVAWVDADPGALAEIAAGVREHHQYLHPPEQTMAFDASGSSGAVSSGPTRIPVGSAAAWNVWLHGLLDRARTQGAIRHDWFDEYLTSANTWTIWAGRPEGMPAFPNGFSRPKPPSTGKGGADALYDRISPTSWWENWTARCLGISKVQASSIVRIAWEQLTAAGIADQLAADTGEPVWALPRHRILLTDIPDEHAGHAELVCGVCHHRHPAPAHLVDVYEGAPCLRWRCPGRFASHRTDTGNYYRGFYRSGLMRRVVAVPHTALLDYESRTRIETQFKNPTAPDAPNVLTATPTLEMGIDIGDLSAVMLTSIPRKQASHAQRIGRAGRRTGNSLVTTFAETDPLSLYYLSEPETMLSGELRPPDCYLDANEILARHLLGHAVDRSADGTFNAGPVPFNTSKLITGWGTNGWLELLVIQVESDPSIVDGFLDQFTGHLTADLIDWLRNYATSGLRARVTDAVSTWRSGYKEHQDRAGRIRDKIKVLEAKAHLTSDEAKHLDRLRGEHKAVLGALGRLRNDRPLDTLEDLGLLPNYTLTEDKVTLRASLWFKNDDGDFDTRVITYERGASGALTELAPGATFYGGQYKVVIDTLDIGPSTQPLYESFRTCPECAYAVRRSPGETAGACPRCKSPKFKDDEASVHKLLRFRSVASTQSEVNSRVYDETDSRTRVPFDRITTVDIDPQFISGTWQHSTSAFAFEFTDHAVIRSINAGRTDRAGAKTRIAGRDLEASWFQVCDACGIVAGVRPKDRNTGGEHHNGYCTSKKGDTPEAWDLIGLYHETTTEAVRLLLPVADMESDTRVASFKAALLLGLRLSFGGDPDHLRIVVTDHPTNDPEQRQRLLVVHDTVTGGTGYVKRLADPDQMRSILEAARRAIATCPCRAEEKVACHRCLLGTADRRDIPHVTRAAALDIIEPLLDAWGGALAPTDITGIDVSGVRQSELEQKFKRLLHLLDNKTLPWGTSCTVAATPAGNGKSSFDLRFANPDGTNTRWRITEQVPIATHPITIADFVAARQDITGFPEIAIYLDGYTYHATAQHNRLDGDAQRRVALREGGRVVWLATWDDINDAERAWTREPPVDPRPARAWPNAVAAAAEADPKAPDTFTGLRPRITANPFYGLLTFLSEPDLAGWRATARRTALAWFKAAATGKTPAVATAKTGDHYEATDLFLTTGTVNEDPSGETLTVTVDTSGGLRCLITVVNPPDGHVGLATALPSGALDLTAPEHPDRWQSWLHVANLAQFLDSEADTNTVTTTILADAKAISTTGRLSAAAGPAPSPSAAMTIPDGDIIIDSVLKLATAAVEAGAPPPIGGHEPGGTDGAVLIEAAWPDHKLGIIDPAADLVHLDDWATENGWELRPPAGWTASEIADRTKGTP